MSTQPGPIHVQRSLALRVVFGAGISRLGLADADHLLIRSESLAARLESLAGALAGEAAGISQPDSSWGVVLTTPNLIFAYCNQAFASLLEYDTPADVLRIGHALQLVDADERAAAIDDWQFLLTAPDPPPKTYCLKTRRGGRRLVEIHAAALVNAQGSLGGLMALARGVAPHPAALAPASAMSRVSAGAGDPRVAWDHLFAHSPIGLVLADLDGRCLAVNPAFCRMIDYSADELLGRPFQDFTHPDDLPANLAGGRDLIEGKRTSFQIDKRYLRKDGQTLWVSLSASVVRSADGAPLFVLSQIQDITAYKQAQRESQTLLERYRAVVEDQTELICRYLPDTTLTFVNEAYCRFVGRQRAELIGVRFTELGVIPEEERGALQARLSALGSAERIVVTEHHVRRADGELRWMQWVNRAIIDDSGQVTELQAIGRDTTERREMEQALRDAIGDARSREVEARDLARQLVTARDDERNRIAERLHNGIGHHLLALRKAILSAHPPADTDSPSAGLVQNSLDLLEEVSEQVRALAMDLDSEVLEQSGIGAAARRYVERMAASARQTIRFHATGRLRRMPIEIERVLFRGLKEALANAVRHAQAGEISAQLHIGSRSARLTVQDDGIGFDPSILDIEVNSALSFGLPGLRRQVTLLAGDFSVESAPGKGATIVIEIPLPAGPSRHGQSVRVLIADAHDVTRRGLVATLSETGEYECIEAVDGLMAVHLAEIRQPDLALIDVDLPELAGVEAARQIVATVERTAVIMLSYSYNHQALQNALQAGARGFLLKSAGSQELLQALQAVRAGETFFSPSLAQVARRLQEQPDAHDAFSSLTTREREVLELIVNGYRNKQIGDRLGISVRTVEVHRRNIMDKLGVKTQAQLFRVVSGGDRAHLR